MEVELPVFSYSSVSAATNNFSPQNKLGEGGFGPVYKGGLQNGQEIAVKRLSQKSGQGFEEFRNEILLIAKLQHRNLVRLLGCCIDHVESILMYEYMPNKSLDMFLFGSNKQETLDWKTRTRIVEGIAQGLLYLHEYSRVRIIHRDLKASNILLDDEMNPKISDFGLARIFGGTDSRGYTNRVVGTFGYISPEYALEGLFSTNSDVYSFGVLVVEIISGRKNTGFYKTDSLHLLGHGWDLWISGRGVELVDGKVGSAAASKALRYINVGLLCVQENPNDRPNMLSVVSMLSSEIATLPPPKKPAFSTTNLLSSYSSQPKSYPSEHHLTISEIVLR
ncbi:G-type lectin S-receptor-like serine/threonine-protein kinase At4g03230 [Salvia splendens]|uniref:G-type lectin S-receptor-like serine/threonine-protein kinase At4g03230 n=1 Tax=Salvia splendens TaxID=180675 RepID=UPI001C27C2C4|nr:G-type lectin S-receptor-like serine/threonine-protein kinase At4g03230 [Salvia splendens]